MKKLFFLFLLAALPTAVSAQINWMTLDEALAAQEKNPKKIMMDVYTNWCGPCKLLDKNTFTNADLVSYVNENYYAVKFNAEGDSVIQYKESEFSNPQFDPAKANKRNYPHEFTQYMGIRGYPSIVFLDEEANFIMPVTGYLSPSQLEIYLKLFGEDHYKDVKTREDFEVYRENFQYKFKS